MNNDDLPQYSVLMSVYFKEKASNLKQSIESMLNQTVKTNDFVLVCDGKLTQELDAVIASYEHKNIFKIINISENVGLGNALNEGLKHCKNEIVARMDSDDISFLDRCESQLKKIAKNPELDVISGTILEFSETPKKITGKREVPISTEQIIKYSHKRNPFNHPCIMFKKTAVIAAGGYQEKYPLFEDYYLWVRMLKNGVRCTNIMKPILYMRTPLDIYKRRGGKKYAKDMLKFHAWMLKSKWSNLLDFCLGALLHAIVCVLPIIVRKGIYYILHK